MPRKVSSSRLYGQTDIAVCTWKPGSEPASNVAGEGEPVKIESIPFSTNGMPPATVHEVSICADGAVPDGVITQPVSLSTQGRFVTARYCNRLPVLMGGVCAKGDKLRVSSGRFVVAATGQSYCCVAMVAAVAGDVGVAYYEEGSA